MASPWYVKACMNPAECPCADTSSSATSSPSSTHYHVKRIHANEEIDPITGRYVNDSTTEYHIDQYNISTPGLAASFTDRIKAGNVACELNDANDDMRDVANVEPTPKPAPSPSPASWLDRCPVAKPIP